YSGHLIDFNVRAERMGWLPSAPQLGRNPLGIKAEADNTSFFYNHSSQWRYEKVTAQELLSPLADASKYSGHLI
ncbi:hypothetical protein WDK71_24995, partial [Escherichia coli]